MSDMPASRRGAGAGGREGGGEPTAVLPLAIEVRAISAGKPAITDGEPAISIEDSP